MHLVFTARKLCFWGAVAVLNQTGCNTNLFKHTLPVQKNSRTLAFCFDYGVHLLWHCFDKLIAMSQHLFPSRLAFIFGQDFVLMTGESNHSFSLFQHIPKTSNGVKSGLCGGQFMCENDTHVSSCSALSQLEPE